jgi:hypothetical protein
MRKTSVGLFLAFEVTITDLLMGPSRFESYFTLTMLLSPGGMGSRGHVATTQPQLDLQVEIMSVWSPGLVNAGSAHRNCAPDFRIQFVPRLQNLFVQWHFEKNLQ